MEKEIIRNIGGKYSVSNLGKFYKNGKEVKGRINKGYIEICMHSKRYRLHRLIAQAFIPNPEGKPCVDHINTNRTDNRVENLRWVTHKENSNNPLSKKHYSETKKGRKPKWLMKPVLQFSKDGEFIREWESTRQIERELGYYNTDISACCLKKYKSAYGYLWKYKNEA